MQASQSSEKAKNIEELKLKLRRRERTIAVLSSLLLVSGGILAWTLWPTDASRFVESADYPTASSNVRKFRNDISVTKKSHGVYYSVGDIKNYLDSIFPRLVHSQNAYITRYLQENPGAFDRTKYDWQVGFYWQKSKDSDDKSKHSFFVVPVLVNKDASQKKDVLEYYDENRYPFYDRTGTVVIPNYRGKAESRQVYYSFNTGTMFP